MTAPAGEVFDPPAVAARLAVWFAKSARDLPWRTAPAGKRDPYLVLVSETMLQQTQVSRVLERFPAFMRRFPTLADLAAADERDVLAEWSGMGYYRRARNLHGAAGKIVANFGGRVPRTVEELRTLPGVGRYTAGAIASIAFGVAAPIVDGNVARVLLRIHGRDAATDDKAIQKWLWEEATALVGAAERPGVVNEALMELGATVCIPPPGAPRCERCLLRELCRARATGRELDIPRSKSRPTRKVLHCAVAVIVHPSAGLLVEQRPAVGMWAGLWQAPTVEASAPITATDLAAAVGLPASALLPDSTFEHMTTHRRVVFRVWRAEAPAGFVPRRGLWMKAEQIERLGLATPQRRILLEGTARGTLWA